MLRKLRVKFILVIMTITTIMLSLIMGVIYFFISRSLEIESVQTMRTMDMRPMNREMHDASDNEGYMPYFTIIISEEGEIKGMGGGSFDMSDTDLLQEIVDAVNETNTEVGTLKDYELRFLKSEEPFGKKIVFADISAEKGVLGRMLKGYALMAVSAFFAFLGISILLARWVVKPVEKVWKQQRDFVADASHELKTPLTVITTDSELLHSEVCSEEDRIQLSGSILTMAEQMRGLVEGLLDLARIDSGSMRESMKIVALSYVMADAAMEFDPVFFEHEMTFNYDIEPEITVTGNNIHLHQLATIFLDNAVKYASLKGETRMSLKKVGSKRCLLTVSNQGDPISKEDQRNLFKRFYRVDKARTRTKSYGLGLAIAEAITDEHHGRIWVESQNGYNSFFVELPM